MSDIDVVVCRGVQPHFTCRFGGACYGMICVAPDVCAKREEDLTDSDRARIEAARRDMAGPEESAAEKRAKGGAA